MIYREKQYNDTLCHFNPNHDPNTGQFTSPSGGGKFRQKIAKRMTRADARTRNAKEWMTQQKAKGGGSLSSSQSNMAEVMYDAIAKDYKKLDKLVSKLEKKEGDRMTGNNWKAFNDRRIEIGKDFVERTKAGKFGQFALSMIVPPGFQPLVLGSMKYKYVGD